MELALEHDRFFDLVRQESVQPGTIVPAMALHGKTFVKGKNEVFPIPQPQIDLSGGVLTQTLVTEHSELAGHLGGPRRVTKPAAAGFLQGNKLGRVCDEAVMDSALKKR